MNTNHQDTKGSATGRKRDNQLKAQIALEQINKRGNYFWNLVSTPRSQALLISNAIIITVLVYLVLPSLPGITFEGTIYGAALTAAVMLITGHVCIWLCLNAMKIAFKRIMVGQNCGWLMLTSMVGVWLTLPFKLEVATIYPGCLAMHGFLPWVVTCLMFIVISGIQSKIADFVWPCSKEGIDKHIAH